MEKYYTVDLSSAIDARGNIFLDASMSPIRLSAATYHTPFLSSQTKRV